MKIVLDTNVLVSALVAHGVCSELLEHCVLRHHIVLSEPILLEFKDVLVRKFGFTPGEASAATHLLRSRVSVVRPASLPRPVCRGQDDDVILATAKAAACTAILTGDKDLTALKVFEGIRILSPSDFWRFEREIGEQATGQ